MSDLHFETMADRGKAWTEDLAKRLKSSPVDLIVLAGDIIASNDYNTLQAVFGRFSAIAETISVPGNHEFYGSSPYRKEYQLKRLSEDISNFHVLDNSFITIKGQRFIGATGWFRKDPETNQYHKNCMGDFSYIDKLEPWCYKKNKEFRELLTKELNSEDVVISHHIPSYLGVAPQFKNDQLNRFFVNDLEYLIKERQPKVWCFGHTHFNFRFDIGKTRLYCNPFGYPFERGKNDFNPFLTIEV